MSGAPAADSRAHDASPRAERLDALDGLRFLLSLGVVFFHLVYFGPLAGAISPYDASRGWSFLRFAVQSFFVLSGFVIARSAAGRTRREFVIARTVRLLPAIWACAALTFVAGMTIALPGQPVVTPRALTFAVTLLPLIRSAGGNDWSYWSLTYELRFYAIFAVLLPLLAPSRRVERAASRLLVFAWTWIVLSALAELVPELGPLVLRPYSAYFAVGVLLHAVREGGHRRWAVAGMVAAVGLGVVQAFEEAASQPTYLHIRWDEAVAVSLVSSGLVAIAALAGPARTPGLQAACRRAGAASYPLYLIHQFVGYYVMANALAVGVSRITAVTVAVAFTTALAFAVSIFVEPALANALKRWLARLPGGRARP